MDQILVNMLQQLSHKKTKCTYCLLSIYTVASTVYVTILQNNFLCKKKKKTNVHLKCSRVFITKFLTADWYLCAKSCSSMWKGMVEPIVGVYILKYDIIIPLFQTRQKNSFALDFPRQTLNYQITYIIIIL